MSRLRRILRAGGTVRFDSPWMLLVVATVPWLLGAHGCIEDLSVGVDRYSGLPDASPAMDGSIIDSGPFSCDESSCSGLKPEPVSCENGESRAAECVLVNAACQWYRASCPTSDDAGTEPCECDFIFSFDALGVAADEFACTDGSLPTCRRGANGICSYDCPPDVSCSLEQDTCSTNSFCVFRLGTCGHNGETALCKPKSNTCPQVYEPVCGCDGATYDNTCQAFREGVSIAFNGPCDTKPELCNQCKAQTFALTGELCDDGKSRSGPTCVTKPKGGCAYQWLQCPSDDCPQIQRDAPTTGECWNDKDCEQGQECLEVSVCGCHQTCLSADRPGHCS